MKSPISGLAGPSGPLLFLNQHAPTASTMATRGPRIPKTMQRMRLVEELGSLPTAIEGQCISWSGPDVESIPSLATPAANPQTPTRKHVYPGDGCRSRKQRDKRAIGPYRPGDYRLLLKVQNISSIGHPGGRNP